MNGVNIDGKFYRQIWRLLYRPKLCNASEPQIVFNHHCHLAEESVINRLTCYMVQNNDII